MIKSVEARKQEEIEFHNRLRGKELKEDPEAFAHYTSNYKFYSVDRANREFCHRWLKARCPGKQVLDYCCGDGEYSIVAAKLGARVVGIDISDVSVENCREWAVREGVESSSAFHVMDAESLDFPDESFDVVICAGVLHHLNLSKAYPELARVLRPGGEILCMEPLAHNPLIQLYRRLTPHLRTEFEAQHILRMSDVLAARRSFSDVKLRFFHLAVLAAVPFRNWRGFQFLLGLLERVDSVLLRMPILQKQAWMVVFTLSQPIRAIDVEDKLPVDDGNPTILVNRQETRR